VVEEIEVREQRVEREKSRGRWRCRRWRDEDLHKGWAEG